MKQTTNIQAQTPLNLPADRRSPKTHTITPFILTPPHQLQQNVHQYACNLNLIKLSNFEQLGQKVKNHQIWHFGLAKLQAPYTQPPSQPTEQKWRTMTPCFSNSPLQRQPKLHQSICIFTLINLSKFECFEVGVKNHQFCHFCPA